MTILPQCVFLDNEHGYTITNGESDWDKMPSEENFQNPPIKLENLWRGYKLEDLIECNEGDEDLPVSADFLENYKAALRGESSDWHLIGVSIMPYLIMFKVVNVRTEKYDTLFLSLTGYERTHYPDYVRFGLTVYSDEEALEPRSWHTIVLQRRGGLNRQQTLLTEQDEYGKREINFGIYDAGDDINFGVPVTTENQRVVFGNRSYEYDYRCWPIRVKEYR